MFANIVVVLFAVALCAAVAHADRAGVESALKAMGEAAAQADADAYLSHVAKADPIFFKEQQNWAKDLKRKPPAAVTFAISEPKPPAEKPVFDAKDGKPDPEAAKTPAPRTISTPIFGDKTAKFEMVTTWAMPPDKEADKKVERTVSYPAVFVMGEDGKWLYAGEDWLVLEGGTEEARPRDERFQGVDPESARGVHAKPVQRGARVMYFAGYEEVARLIVEVLPGVRDHVDEGFGNQVPRVQEVKIYPAMRHLQESIYLSYVDGLSGWNEPGEAIKIITNPRRASKRGLTTLLAHEYGHVATFEFGEKANDMPWWVLEGVAELSAERFASMGKDAENATLNWYKKDALAKWDDLADFHKVQDSPVRELQGKVYKQGHHMLGYISDRFGREGRNAWLRAMSQGKTIDEASREAFKMGWDDVDAAWRASVKELAEKQAAEKEKKGAEKKDEEAKPKG